MEKTELLAPAGNFDCLVAAVQNGADSVYFGSNLFSARAFAGNFEGENLEKAIDYAKMRNVKTHLTLNTLIKENEFEMAVELAQSAYAYGIDAIIVQDLGLAEFLIKNFPGLPIHASTQMTIHNLEGALYAQKLGFKRVVLSRELSYEEIEHICKNVNIEIETFIHGALCISYSGQCLFSSMIGARSGNRGKCAQACRLPYELLEGSKVLDKGYLLSPRDVCGLKFIPKLMEAGVDCFKIEGRMKSPEYVATVTRIYRKYINKALLCSSYEIEDEDTKNLMQVFNRGGFSEGHLSSAPNRNLIFKEKPNNMGLYLGSVSSFKPNKGHITLKLEDSIAVGDTISISSETGTYTISELMQKNKNLETANAGQVVTIGRMKGNIYENCKVYKLASKSLSDKARLTFSGQEIKKVSLSAKLIVKQNVPVLLEVSNGKFTIAETSNVMPQEAKSAPITKDRLEAALCKTGNTPYEFNTISILLDDNLFLPLTAINDLRRKALENYAENVRKSYKRAKVDINIPHTTSYQKHTPKISVLLNNVPSNVLELKNVDRFYIPLDEFYKKEELLKDLCKNANVYCYLPNINRNSFAMDTNKFHISGFVISSLGQIDSLKKYNLDMVGNYTLNVYNSNTVWALKNSGISTYTVSPEIEKDAIEALLKSATLPAEMIVYGRLPLMTTHYCLLGKSNLCYGECSKKCKEKSPLHLKDRVGLLFPIVPNSNGTITTIYNSKITSIAPSMFNLDYARIDFLDEDFSTMQEVINTVARGERLEGKDYTSGNLNREV